MSKLIASIVATGALFVAGMSDAAPVNLIFTQTVLGVSTTWDLRMTFDGPSIAVSQVAFNIFTTPVSDFAINPSAYPASIDNFTSSSPSGFSVKGLTPGSPGTLHIAIVAGTAGAIQGGLLGTLTAALGQLSSCGPQSPRPLVACETTSFYGVAVDDGGTVLDDQFAEVPSSVSFVPEPTVMILLGLGLVGLGLVRRSR